LTIPATMNRLLIVIPFLVSVPLRAQTPMPVETRVAISELQTLARQQPDPQKLTAAAMGKFPVALMGGRCMVGFLGKTNADFDPQAIDRAQVHVGACIGGVLSFRVDAYHLAAAVSIPDLAYAELAGVARPNLDKLVHDIHADSVQQGINLPQPYTGAGVLIGDLDWGFDYTHPTFYDTSMSTYRVRAAWDQFRQTGPAPADFGYGAEFTSPAALLAAQGDTANIYSYGTHGTHVAGIMGGGGAGTPYRGVAFGAQFLFCTFLIDAASAIDGVSWMQGIAQQDGKRLVVNMSWGLYYMGTLDGNSLISQALDQFSQDGVVFCISAGNNGDVAFHLGKTFAGDTLRSRVQFYPYSANPHTWGQSLTMWGEPGAAFSTAFKVINNLSATSTETPWFHTAAQSGYVDTLITLGADTVWYNLAMEAADPLNGRPHARLRIKNTHTGLQVVMQATAESGTVHFWNVTELDNGVGNWGQEFQAGQPGWTAGDNQYGIGEPACTETAVTVAAHQSQYVIPGGTNTYGGNIAGFSSFGPTLDGRIKPDISAPGVSVASSISSFTDNAYTAVLTVPFQGRTYPFARFSGTSMAAPATTGTVALMLEADPTLTPAQVRDIIRNTARTDNFTGTIPPGGSTRWGMGKLNAYHAVTDVLGTTAVRDIPADEPAVWPNPTTGLLHIPCPDNGSLEPIRITDALGRTLHAPALPGRESITLDIADWPAGIYLIHFLSHGKRVAAKVVKA
jgi:subtilisin family serine protease